MSFSLIILAGGNSHRFKSNIGKPYQKIAGKSLIEININKARNFTQIKKVVLVYNKKDSKRLSSLNLKNIKFNIISGENFSNIRDNQRISKIGFICSIFFNCF